MIFLLIYIYIYFLQDNNIFELLELNNIKLIFGNIIDI